MKGGPRMYFAICDDNREHLNLLKEMFDQQTAFAIETESYESGEELVRDYIDNNRHYDALFIDMEMGGMNGIDTANAIRAIDEHIPIVFVSVHTKYMQESFKCAPFRFLVKPLNSSDLAEAVQAIAKKCSQTNAVLNITVQKEHLRLYCNDILYCECHDHSMVIVTKDDTYRVNKTIAELEKLLPAEQFARTHKAFLVNLSWVKRIKGSNITLYHTDTIIPLGRTYKDHFMKAYLLMQEKELCL